MRILLLSHYYWPEIGAPQRRWSTMVGHLIAKGHEIVVAAPHPHYPYTRRDEFFGSRVGRQRTRVRARLGGSWDTGELGERIIRVPYLHSGSSMTRQMLDQTVAAAGAIITSLRTLRGAHRPDVIISTTPALPTLLAGDFVSRLLRVPHIAEVRDAWPDLIHELSLVTNATGRFFPTTLAGRLEDSVLPGFLTRAQQRAAAVVVTTESFAHRLQDRGINATVVRSGVSRAEIESDTFDAGDQSRARDGVNLLYVGTVGRSQDLGNAIRAAALVPGVRLRIVGDGADKAALVALAEKLAAPADFYPQSTGTDLASHWDWADAGLVSLGDVPAHTRTVPSKVYSLMVRRVPVLGIVAGEAAEIITMNGAGTVAHPGDIASIAEAMRLFSSSVVEPSLRARQWAIDHASVEVMGSSYDALLEEVCR
ncbi:glycosyltransferase family 4 protein [Brevibacterium casei]|uniref:glycosyltransferase family 4 protein n=1 Tax=Brevibacterium TaxID=1696 RepID=UPI0015E7FA6E|nr:glycosyltransferase family 4 protein [Brevibacterium sp. XM4083]